MFTHWGTFNRGAPLNACHVIAQNALIVEGFPLVNTAADGAQFLLGSTGSTMVTVFLDPLSPVATRITVTAHSDESAAAESARNRVRTRIVSA